VIKFQNVSLTPDNILNLLVFMDRVSMPSYIGVITDRKWHAQHGAAIWAADELLFFTLSQICHLFAYPSLSMLTHPCSIQFITQK